MSRVPLYLKPSPLDRSAGTFAVISEEWSDLNEAHKQLGAISYDSAARKCTFVPAEMWLSEGFYPRGPWSGGESEVTAELESHQGALYTRRLFQAIKSVLDLRK